MREFSHNQHIGVSRMHHDHSKREPNPGCKTGGFYTSPTAGQTVNAGEKLAVTWDPTCLEVAKADIYLYAPGADNTRIYLWEGVDFKKGTYDVTLKPKWWNSTDTQSLQFAIVEYGGSLFMNEYPAGPIFTAKYDKNAGTVPAADADSAIPDTGYTIVKTPEPQSSKSGKIAAGLLVPLLLIGVCVAAWLVITRRRNKEKRKRASVAIDKRMSTISTDWKPMSAVGATAAIRQSIAVSNGDRTSSAFSFGAIRPVSTITTDGSQTGVGARRLYNADNTSRLSQARVSRVSFAEQTRPSMESRRAAGTSRAFHSAYIPPLPTRQGSIDSDESVMSPTQTQGALPLSDDHIQSKASSNFEDVLPALNMMQTDAGGDKLFYSQEPEPESPITPPAPAHPKSPIIESMPMPSVVMSPDEMLRAYAERRSATPGSRPTSPGIAYPAPTLNLNGMQALYSPPPAPASLLPVAPGTTSVPMTRKSVAPTVGSSYSNDDEGVDDSYTATAH